MSVAVSFTWLQSWILTMAKSLILLSTILTFLSLLLPQTSALIFAIAYETTSSCSAQPSDNSLACQLEEAELRIGRLESILGERIGDVNGKSQYLKECEKKIEELAVEVDRLKTTVSTFGDDESRAVGKISALEEEIRLLWAASRKSNFEVHSLESRASDAEQKLKELTSQVEKMSEIVSEQWIQIKQLDQAVYMAEVTMKKVTKELWRRCPFLKFFMDVYDYYRNLLNGILDPYAPRYGPVLLFCKTQALQIISAAKNYHHQLQGLIKHTMRNNELTAALAHEEVVFFVASALVAFPIMAACMLFLSQLH